MTPRRDKLIGAAAFASLPGGAIVGILVATALSDESETQALIAGFIGLVIAVPVLVWAVKALER